MRVVGFISEYNPFHLGHKYHLSQSKKQTKSHFSIAVMSGSFLQRGEPALIDKWTRAKMAIDNGVDLVLELPFIFSSQSAESFAYGGVKLLDSLNIVDYISFGSESEDLEPLKTLANILSNEPETYTFNLKSNLSLGLSFPRARSKALCQYINNYMPKDEYDYKTIIESPNNILAIEYLKALDKIDSKIKPISIKRSGSNYKDLALTNGFASATAIRNQIKIKGISAAENLLSKESYNNLKEYFYKYNSFNYLENYSQILLYLLRTIDKEKLISLIDMETGLENRMINMAFENNNIIDIVNNIVTKRYPRSRIQRLLIHLLHDLNQANFQRLYKEYPSYARVLGANQNGLSLLRKIKKSSSLAIITKFADYKKHRNDILEKTISFDKKSTDIFFLGLKTNKVLSNMDYYTSPYIKKI